MEVTTARVTSRQAGEIEIDGTTYEVRKPDGYTAERTGVALADAKSADPQVRGKASADLVWLAGRLIGLTREQSVGTEGAMGLLDDTLAGQILEIAGRPVKAVEIALGKDGAASVAA